jgi:cytochrome c oxidase subunit I+III
MWDAGGLHFAESGSHPGTESLGTEGAKDRETPVATGVDARPEATMRIPHETYVPFMVALGVAVIFVGLLVKATLVGVVGVVVGAFAILRWTWHTEADLR